MKCEHVEIETFLGTYQDKKSRGKADLSMKELRHIIPLLVMYCFGIKDEPGQKKVKGMWAEKPQGWPEQTPYCDPNNPGKGEGKPRKETLMLMFNYLKPLFESMNGGMVGSTAEVPSPVSDKAYEVPSPQYTKIALPATVEAHSVSSTISTPSPSHTIIIQPAQSDSTFNHTPAIPDPAAEIISRIKNKVEEINAKGVIPEADIALLHIVNDLLCKMFMMKENQIQLFFQSAHEFECTLDLIIYTGKFSTIHKEKWREFEGKWQICLQEAMMNLQRELTSVPMVAEEVEVQTLEENIPSDDILGEACILNTDNMPTLSAKDLDDLGIDHVTIGTVDELQHNGLLEVRLTKEVEECNSTEISTVDKSEILNSVEELIIEESLKKDIFGHVKSQLQQNVSQKMAQDPVMLGMGSTSTDQNHLVNENPSLNQVSTRVEVSAQNLLPSEQFESMPETDIVELASRFSNITDLGQGQSPTENEEKQISDQAFQGLLGYVLEPVSPVGEFLSGSPFDELEKMETVEGKTRKYRTLGTKNEVKGGIMRNMLMERPEIYGKIDSSDMQKTSKMGGQLGHMRSDGEKGANGSQLGAAEPAQIFKMGIPELQAVLEDKHHPLQEKLQDFFKLHEGGVVQSSGGGSKLSVSLPASSQHRQTRQTGPGLQQNHGILAMSYDIPTVVTDMATVPSNTSSPSRKRKRKH